MPFDRTISHIPSIHASEVWVPPEWAMWQRRLLDVLDRAAVEFAARYTRPDRTLIWRDKWPGMDGSDDPYEGFMYYPLLYAMGGSESVYRLSRELWESITWQWTEYGQIHREFDAYYDWLHHGEGCLFFYFFGLAEPAVLKDRQRAVRFAAMYTGDDPEAPNFDKERKLIRSPMTGSRGPRFVHTEEDWATYRGNSSPFEDVPGVDGGGSGGPWSDGRVFAEILRRINERMAKGDVPLNLNATTLVTHAFLYTGNPAWRGWVLDYVNAWRERTQRNGGIVPDNVGLSGEIGEYNDGKWWGGYYGWRWPHGSFSVIEPLIVAGSNAVLLTGKTEHLELARSQLDALWALRRNERGRWVVPNRHLDDGWRDYRIPHPMYPVYLWNVSMSDEDAERVERGWQEELYAEPDARFESFGETTGSWMGFNGNTVQWYRYIRGRDPGYPMKILRCNYETVVGQLAKIRSDAFDPRQKERYEDPMSIHEWQMLSPMVMEGLAQLMWGGPMHVYRGGFQHARVRYYDAAARRPGLPPDVAALVEKLDAETATLSLVNLSLFEEREVIIQAGMFGEHMIREARIVEADGTGAAGTEAVGEETAPLSVAGRWLRVRLGTGCGIRLELRMDRYANVPSYETPWFAPDRDGEQIEGREGTAWKNGRPS